MPPSNITIKKIDEPTEAIVADATQIQCELMHNDPLLSALAGGQRDIMQVMVRGMIADVAFRTGEMYGAFNEEGAMVGFQTWTPPGKKQFMFINEEGKARRKKLLEALPEGSRTFLHTIGEDLQKLQDTLSGIPECEVTTYWCNANFVKEEYHKQGISKALMNLAVHKAKANGWTQMTLFTTNERNVTIYERLGFVNEGYKLLKIPSCRCPMWVFVRTLE